ncbi:hypothetical protein [Rhodobacter sp. JA431]|uniref:hypothetical protein n=1 Tax=Rhodobacter sp. JA431 TaxID=570013 RepID=UPI00148207F3|nr:hypothetical protein [Rhodobacter sp. JA431]
MSVLPTAHRLQVLPAREWHLLAPQGKPAWPWLLTMLIFLVLITYVPAITLTLPGLLGM